MKEWMIDEQYCDEVRHSVGSTSINMKERSKDNRTIDMTNLVRNPMVILKLKIFVRCLYAKLPFIKENLRGFLGIGIKKSATVTPVVATNPTILVQGVRDIIQLGFNFLKYLLW